METLAANDGSFIPKGTQECGMPDPFCKPSLQIFSGARSIALLRYQCLMGILGACLWGAPVPEMSTEMMFHPENIPRPVNRIRPFC